MNIRRVAQSFLDAGRGIKFVFKHEENFRIQVFIAIIVFICSWIFQLSKAEKVLVVILIMLVIILELLNSAVEKFSDILKPRLSYQIQVVKDIMAAVVFFASFCAVIIGLIIFWPHLIEMIGQI